MWTILKNSNFRSPFTSKRVPFGSPFCQKLGPPWVPFLQFLGPLVIGEQWFADFSTLADVAIVIGCLCAVCVSDASDLFMVLRPVRRVLDIQMSRTRAFRHSYCKDGVLASFPTINNGIQYSNAGRPVGFYRISTTKKTKYRPHSTISTKYLQNYTFRDKSAHVYNGRTVIYPISQISS